MAITFNGEIEKLIELRMRETGLSSPEELVRFALETLEPTQGLDFEDLDPTVQRSIDIAEAEYERGEGIPADEVFAMLRKKHFGH